jgi:nitrogen fixation protein NifU and related proteins
MKYSAIILDHFHQPRNVGCFPAEESNVARAKIAVPNGGDIVQLEIKVNAENKIEKALFKAYGSVATIAAASWATEWLQQKTLTEVTQISSTEIMNALELPSVKIHVALLIEDLILTLTSA